MLSLDAAKLAIINGTVKSASWLFDVVGRNGVAYFWSTKYSEQSIPADGFLGDPTADGFLSDPTADGFISGTTAFVYTFKVVDFTGITLIRPKTESGLVPPSELEFSVINKDNVLAADDLEGGYLTLRLFMGNGTDAEVEIASWKFLIKKVEGAYQLLKVTCEDFFQQYIEGDYPGIQYRLSSSVPAWVSGVVWGAGIAWPAGTEDTATGYGIKVRDIFPAAEGDIDDDCCLPLPFGTCYIPIRSAYIDADRYYVLGPTIAKGVAVSYDISACRTPRGYSAKTEYASPGYSFDQYTRLNAEDAYFRTFQAMIAAGPSNGLFPKGDNFYDLPTKFSRSDTAAITNPADVLEYVLKDMGVAAGDIGSSFASAHTTFDGWGLAFNGAFWKVMTREKVLSLLLAMCHATMDVRDKLELRVLSSTSQKTITAADIIRGGDTGMGTFQFSMFTRTLADSGNLSYSPTGDSQDIGVNALVPAKVSRINIDPEIFETPFIQDAAVASEIARLYFQRKLLKKSEERFTAKATCIALQPGDFITLSGDNYGGVHDVIIDSMKINRDVSIELSCTGFTDAIESFV